MCLKYKKAQLGSCSLVYGVTSTSVLQRPTGLTGATCGAWFCAHGLKQMAWRQLLVLNGVVVEWFIEICRFQNTRGVNVPTPTRRWEVGKEKHNSAFAHVYKIGPAHLAEETPADSDLTVLLLSGRCFKWYQEQEVSKFLGHFNRRCLPYNLFSLELVGYI